MAWVDLDVSAWNLAGAAALGTAIACGPSVPISGETEGEESSGSSADDAPTSQTSPSTTPTTQGPTTATTTSPPPECYSDEDCAPGYYCYAGYCQYYCCDDDVWYYECYSHSECESDSYCEFNYCTPAQPIEDCGELSLNVEIPDFDSGQVRGLTFTDFDGDGLSDLAISHADGVEIAFAAGGSNLPLSVSGTPGQIFSGDVDGDTDEDLLVAVDIDGDWGVALIENDAGSGYPTTTPIQSAVAGREFAVGDFNGNGALDVAVRFDSVLEFFAGINNGTFGSAVQEIDVIEAIYPLSHNQDAATDLIRIRDNFVNLGHGADTFAFEWLFLSESHAAQGRQLVAADIGGDGVPEIFAISTDHVGTSLVAQWSGADLNQQPYTSFGASTEALTVADIEGDGTEAIIVGTLNGVEMLRGSPLLDCRIELLNAHGANLVASRADGNGRTSIAASDGIAVTILREP